MYTFEMCFSLYGMILYCILACQQTFNKCNCSCVQIIVHLYLSHVRLGGLGGLFPCMHTACIYEVYILS